MTINIRQKGQEGEREIARMLNQIVASVRHDRGLPQFDKKDELFQRNQNQSAVGGDDLSNPLGLSIEVKRQEALSIPAWWKQCCESASRTDSLPILLFRQNRKKWRCCMDIDIPFGDNYSCTVTGEICIDSFKRWFYCFYEHELIITSITELN